MILETLTLSLTICPACGKPHHLPLVFQETETPGEYKGQCTNNLQLIPARINEVGRLEVGK